MNIDFAAAYTMSPAASGYRLRPALRAHAMVCSTLGSTWIDEQAARIDLPGRTTADVHPLYFTLSGQTERCIVEVCALAGLLLHFRDDPELRQMITSLRDPNKYEATMLEFGHRLEPFRCWRSREARAANDARRGRLRRYRRRPRIHRRGERFPRRPFRSDLMALNGWLQHSLKSALCKTPVSGHVAVEIVLTPLSRDGAPVNLRVLRKEDPRGTRRRCSLVCEWGWSRGRHDLRLRDRICTTGPTARKPSISISGQWRAA